MTPIASVLTINAERQKLRIRLMISLALYGGALGAATVLVSLLNRTPFGTKPEHLPWTPTVYISLSGAIAGILIALLLGHIIGGMGAKPRNLLAWWMFGFAFGVMLPFLTGGLLPMSVVFLNLSLDIIQPGDLFGQLTDAVLRAPQGIFRDGTLSLFTGLLAGALFGTGGWLVDMFNTSSKPMAARVGPWVVVSILGSVFFAIAVFGSADALSKLG